ncbi:butyrate kinase [Eubacteriaceae bacterium ES3]|nr:butyrate kinase [Eubacteriaceae bacterium ES3]
MTIHKSAIVKMNGKYILVINPGSLSTKIGVYKDEEMLFSEAIVHQESDLDEFKQVNDQYQYRLQSILQRLDENQFDLSVLSLVMGRGGLLPPVKSGAYLVDDTMKALILSGKLSEHASNLGALLADGIAAPLGINAYIYDAVSADEMIDIARISGFPEIERKSFCHVLNGKAMGRKFAREWGREYFDLNLVVAHLGSGISISAHCKGKIIDVVADDSGPFSPERSGTVPLLAFVDYCYEQKLSKAQIKRKIRGNGGFKAYFGIADLREIEKMIENNDQQAKMIFEAQAYQIAKGIGEMATVLKGKMDAIILTGGMAYSQKLMNLIRPGIDWIGDVFVMAGENELEALALGGLRILRGERISPAQG